MSKKPIIIIGGGPAGSVCAGILAEQGVECLVLEKSKHPRHHVGESLQPATFELLDHYLGVKKELQAQGYAYKFGAVYIWGESRKPWRILFDQRLEEVVDNLSEQELLQGDYEHALQVDRASFDKILFDAMKRKGAKALEHTEVTRVLFAEDGRATGVELLSGEVLEADVVVDASGQRCMIGKQLNWVENIEDLRSVAVYGYFEGTDGLPEPLGRHVQYVVTVPEGWLWFIPISETHTSIGLVTKSKRKFSEAEFLEIIQGAEIPLGDGQLVEWDGERIRYVRDWSYASKKFAGENFLLLGDAACFVDPILSGGVDFSVRSGATAAQAILSGLKSGSFTESFAEYERRLRKEYRAYLRMARYWYGNNRSVDGFFWEASQLVDKEALSTPVRAFVYLTSGRYATDQHFKIFPRWQEEIMFEAIGVDRKQTQDALRKYRGK